MQEIDLIAALALGVDFLVPRALDNLVPGLTFFTKGLEPPMLQSRTVTHDETLRKAPHERGCSWMKPMHQEKPTRLGEDIRC